MVTEGPLGRWEDGVHRGGDFIPGLGRPQPTHDGEPGIGTGEQRGQSGLLTRGDDLAQHHRVAAA